MTVFMSLGILDAVLISVVTLGNNVDKTGWKSL